MLMEMRRYLGQGESFAFETTLSGRSYAQHIPAWQSAGYRVELIFLKLRSIRLALARVKARVAQGGHHVPAAVVRRRFKLGWRNFERSIACWSITGSCTITRANRRFFLPREKSHEGKSNSERQKAGAGCFEGPAPRREKGGRAGPSNRNPGLCAEEWPNRRRRQASAQGSEDSRPCVRAGQAYRDRLEWKTRKTRIDTRLQALGWKLAAFDASQPLTAYRHTPSPSTRRRTGRPTTRCDRR
jgi:hypothetical protein